LINRRALRPGMPRHPLMHALWLETSNRLLFFGGTARRRLPWLMLCLGLVGVATAVTVSPRFLSGLMQEASVHIVPVSILIALPISLLVHRSRREWTDFYRSSWLSALPLRRSEIARMIALRSCLVPGIIVLVLSVAGGIAGKESSGSARAGLVALAGIAIAGLVGGLLGWFMPFQETRASRSSTSQTSLRAFATDAGLAGLSHWVTAQARAWLQPRFLARILLPAMLALPMDVSANVAIGLLTVWTTAVYLCVLLTALVTVARKGAAWLRPTPVSLSRFAWAVARTPALRQLQWTVIAAVFLTALGCSPLWALRAAEWWLALVTVTSSITIAQAHRSAPWRLRLLLSVSALALLERVREHAALPGALLVSAWHLRKAARA
jgi:hypothetical protein